MPLSTPFVDSLLINGTDIQSLTGVWITDLSWFWAPLDRWGIDEEQDTPGSAGIAFPVAGLPLASFTFTVPILIRPTNNRSDEVAADDATRYAYVQNVNALGALLLGTGSDGLVTAARRITTAADGSHTDQPFNCRVLKLALTEHHGVMAEGAITLDNLDGTWDGATP